MDKAVDGYHALFAVRDRVDREFRAVVNIAADEDVGLACLEGRGIRNHCAVSAKLHIRSFKQAAPIGGLSDRHQNIAARDRDRLVLVVNGSEAMLFIKDASALLEDDRRDFAVLGEYFFGTPSVHDGDSFFFYFRNFVLCSRHLFPGLETEHGHLAVRHAKSSAGHVSSHIAAADDYDIAGEPHGIVLINAAQEVDSCDHALSGFAGHAGKSASLKADRDVESLEAAGAELVDRNVPSDIDAALYFDAHAPDDLDLSFHDVFLKTEGRNAVHEHTAGAVLTLEDCDGILFRAQVISGAQTCRACADDCDGIVVPLIALTVLTDGQILRERVRRAVFYKIQFAKREELFDLIDSDRRVNKSARAAVLAAAIADRSADCRERIVLAYEFKSLLIAALRSHPDIALDCQVRGTCRLAGGCARVVTVDLVVVAVIGIPLVLAPDVVVGKFMHGIDHFAAICLAELLAQSRRAGGTYFHALAAGDAFGRVHMGAVCAAGHIGRIEELGCAQAVAAAR